MVLTISRDVDHLTSQETWVAWDLSAYLMLLSVKDDLYSLSSYLHCITESLLQCAKNILRISILHTVDNFVAEIHQQSLL